MNCANASHSRYFVAMELVHAEAIKRMLAALGRAAAS
jgi:hypothetical protein